MFLAGITEIGGRPMNYCHLGRRMVKSGVRGDIVRSDIPVL